MTETINEIFTIEGVHFTNAGDRSETAAQRLHYVEDMLVDALYRQLNELLTAINAREPGRQFPTGKELSIQSRLVRCICDLKKPKRSRDLNVKHWKDIINSILTDPR
jgi:hypothetical protein